MPRALGRLEAQDAQPDPIAALHHAWAKDASNLFQRIAALEGVLEAAKADLQQLGHLSRDTIRRVCSAVTRSAVSPDSSPGGETPGPASVGSGDIGASS